MRFFLLCIGLCCLCALSVAAQESVVADEPPAPEFTLFDSVVLGVVEGLTEYLPVSSTGHLILTNRALGLDSDLPALNRSGGIVYSDELDETGQQRPYTMKDAADAYAIVIQAGAILAVLFLYWRRVWEVVLGCLGRSRAGLLLARNLIVAFLPAAALGPFLDDYLEAYLFAPVPVAVALCAGAVLMFWIERRRRKLDEAGELSDELDLQDLSWQRSLLIGALQCVAMWPGTSRSMMSIAGGYLAGLSPARAAEFSFLLGLITLTAASAYRVLTDGSYLIQVIDPMPALVGCLVATVAALLSVKWLVGFLTRRGLTPFAYYRIALAVLVLVFWS